MSDVLREFLQENASLTSDQGSLQGKARLALGSMQVDLDFEVTLGGGNRGVNAQPQPADVAAAGSNRSVNQLQAARRASPVPALAGQQAAGGGGGGAGPSGQQVGGGGGGAGPGGGAAPQPLRQPAPDPGLAPCDDAAATTPPPPPPPQQQVSAIKRISGAAGDSQNEGSHYHLCWP